MKVSSGIFGLAIRSGYHGCAEMKRLAGNCATFNVGLEKEKGVSVALGAATNSPRVYRRGRLRNFWSSTTKRRPEGEGWR